MLRMFDILKCPWFQVYVYFVCLSKRFTCQLITCFHFHLIAFAATIMYSACSSLYRLKVVETTHNGRDNKSKNPSISVHLLIYYRWTTITISSMWRYYKVLNDTNVFFYALYIKEGDRRNKKIWSTNINEVFVIPVIICLSYCHNWLTRGSINKYLTYTLRVYMLTFQNYLIN